VIWRANHPIPPRYHVDGNRGLGEASSELVTLRFDIEASSELVTSPPDCRGVAVRARHVAIRHRGVAAFFREKQSIQVRLVCDWPPRTTWLEERKQPTNWLQEELNETVKSAPRAFKVRGGYPRKFLLEIPIE
jgi:hypothetical protein